MSTTIQIRKRMVYDLYVSYHTAWKWQNYMELVGQGTPVATFRTTAEARAHVVKLRKEDHDIRVMRLEPRFTYA